MFFLCLSALVAKRKAKKKLNMPQSQEDPKIHKEKFESIPESIEQIGRLIVDSAYTVHYNLGPGLLEKIYEVCFLS